MDIDKLCNSKKINGDILNFGEFVLSKKIDYYQRSNEPLNF